MLIELDLLAFTVFRLAYGTLLIAVLFVPFGIYHSMTEPYLSGALWGFMLPVGYVAAASGLALILYPRLIPLKKLGIGYLLILIGFLMLFSVSVFPDEWSINLLHGTSFGHGWIDIDYSKGNEAVVILSFLSVGVGFAVKIKQMFDRQQKKT